MRRLLVCILVLLLSACQTTPSIPPTPIVRNAAVVVNDTVIRWVRSPEEVIFRAEVTIGNPENAVVPLREIPLCTIYGDNRVVWVNELGAFNIEVLYDRIEDYVIGDFLMWLTVNQRIYTYQTPADSETGAVVESVSINVNGINHTANGFSGWSDDWFSSVLNACRSLSQAPVLFQPTGGWLTVQSAPYDDQAPSITWNQAGVDLAALAGAPPMWVTGGIAVRLWELQLTQPSRFLLVQGDQHYAVALQVPGISRTSPPAPR